MHRVVYHLSDVSISVLELVSTVIANSMDGISGIFGVLSGLVYNVS